MQLTSPPNILHSFFRPYNPGQELGRVEAMPAQPLLAQKSCGSVRTSSCESKILNLEHRASDFFQKKVKLHKDNS